VTLTTGPGMGALNLQLPRRVARGDRTRHHRRRPEATAAEDPATRAGVLQGVPGGLRGAPTPAGKIELKANVSGTDAANRDVTAALRSPGTVGAPLKVTSRSRHTQGRPCAEAGRGRRQEP
jgi:hypothetical protein